MLDADNYRQLFEESFIEGSRLLHQGKAAEALPLLEKAYQLELENTDVAINLSGAYILTKKFKKAIMILEPASNRDPNNAMIWVNLGAAYLGNPVLASEEAQIRAIDAFTQALTLNPAAPSVAYNIGLIYRDRNEIDEAMYWFGQAIKTNPNDGHARSIYERLAASRKHSG